MVVVNHPPRDRSRTKAEEVVREIEHAGGRAIPIAADISREEDVEAMFAQTVERLGQVDILINNAGIERPAPIQEMPLADWQAVIDVNLTGQFLCSRAAARIFLKKNTGRAKAGPIGTILPARSARPSIARPGRATRKWRSF
jgi:glucose 1-dehydrogenase